MPKSLVPQDFQPTDGTIAVLKAWFAVARPVKIGKISYPSQMWIMGDRHIDDEFIKDRYQIAKFISFWSDESQSAKYDRNKSNWQAAYMYEIKREWPKACKDYEKGHGKRSDSGSQGLTPFTDAMTKLMQTEAPKQQRRYRIKSDAEYLEEFKQLEQKFLK